MIACVKLIKEDPFSFIISVSSISVGVDDISDFGLNVIVGNT
jgi:hypothetical protein